MPCEKDPSKKANPRGSALNPAIVMELLKCAQACGVTSLAYEGLEVTFGRIAPQKQPQDDTFLLSRKKESNVPPQLPEVVALAQDYDRWDRFEDPPGETDA